MDDKIAKGLQSMKRIFGQPDEKDDSQRILHPKHYAKKIKTMSGSIRKKTSVPSNVELKSLTAVRPCDFEEFCQDLEPIYYTLWYVRKYLESTSLTGTFEDLKDTTSFMTAGDSFTSFVVVPVASGLSTKGGQYLVLQGCSEDKNQQGCIAKKVDEYITLVSNMLEKNTYDSMFVGMSTGYIQAVISNDATISSALCDVSTFVAGAAIQEGYRKYNVALSIEAFEDLKEPEHNPFKLLCQRLERRAKKFTAAAKPVKLITCENYVIHLSSVDALALGDYFVTAFFSATGFSSGGNEVHLEETNEEICHYIQLLLKRELGMTAKKREQALKTSPWHVLISLLEMSKRFMCRRATKKVLRAMIKLLAGPRPANEFDPDVILAGPSFLQNSIHLGNIHTISILTHALYPEEEPEKKVQVETRELSPQEKQKLKEEKAKQAKLTKESDSFKADYLKTLRNITCALAKRGQFINIFKHLIYATSEEMMKCLIRGGSTSAGITPFGGITFYGEKTSEESSLNKNKNAFNGMLVYAYLFTVVLKLNKILCPTNIPVSLVTLVSATKSLHQGIQAQFAMVHGGQEADRECYQCYLFIRAVFAKALMLKVKHSTDALDAETKLLLDLI